MKIESLLVCLWIGAGMVVGALADEPGAQLDDRARHPPNIVLILSDDQGWEDYSFMGHEVIQTPHLDRLAQQSLVFTRGYVPTSLCRPSLATIITGLYPHQHGITGNDPKTPEGKNVFQLRHERDTGYLAQVDRYNGFIEQVPTLPRLFAKAGYVSFQSGKWWEGNYSRGGFTHGMTHGDPTRGGRHGDEGLKIGRQTMQPVFDFIDSAVQQDKPFFLWYAPIMPHFPHTPPQRLLDKYTAPGRPDPLARYYAMCEWFDETCGQLLEHLDRRNLGDNTLVLYVVDNGWTQRGKTEVPFGAARGKNTPYDGGIRTPIMLRWPGRIEPKRDDQTLVSSIDLAPTILAACGLSSSPHMQGLDLLDVAALAGRDAVFGDIYTHDAQDLEKPAASLLYRWTVAGQWKVILPHRPNLPDEVPELYDIGTDPHEERNLTGSHPQRMMELAEAINTWWEPRKE